MYMYIYVYVYIHVCIYMYIPTYLPTYLPTYTYLPTFLPTYLYSTLHVEIERVLSNENKTEKGAKTERYSTSVYQFLYVLIPSTPLSSRPKFQAVFSSK